MPRQEVKRHAIKLEREQALVLMQVLHVSPRPPEALQFAGRLLADGTIHIDLMVAP